MTIAKEVFRAGPFADFFAQGVKVGDTLYLAGQIGVGHDGVVGADIVAQTELVYANVGAVLAEFGASAQNIVDETWFVTDVDAVMGRIEEVATVRQQFYGGIPEVSQTLVRVAGLVDPDWLIEIKCIARLAG